jgi:hypothetical protein
MNILFFSRWGEGSLILRRNVETANERGGERFPKRNTKTILKKWFVTITCISLGLLVEKTEMFSTYGGSLTIYSVTGHGQPTGSDLPTTGLVGKLRVLRHAKTEHCTKA